MTATSLAIVGHLGQVIAIVVVVLIGLGVLMWASWKASPAITVAQPSKPAISGIGFLKLRWVLLNDSGRIEGERSFRSGDCTVEPFQQSFYRPLLRSLWRLVLVP